MIKNRRNCFQAISSPPDDANTGLWLDKFMPEESQRITEPKRELVTQIAGIPQPNL